MFLKSGASKVCQWKERASTGEILRMYFYLAYDENYRYLHTSHLLLRQIPPSLGT